MITVGMDYKIVPGKDDEFIAVFKKVMGIIADMPGRDSPVPRRRGGA